MAQKTSTTAYKHAKIPSSASHAEHILHEAGSFSRSNSIHSFQRRKREKSHKYDTLLKWKDPKLHIYEMTKYILNNIMKWPGTANKINQRKTYWLTKNQTNVMEFT